MNGSTPGNRPHFRDWAVIIPMANEERDFSRFTRALATILDELRSGRVYFIVDEASRDRTLLLCRELAERDHRFVALWAPESRNVVDAYLCGYREALDHEHEFIVEMDAGMSHDPFALPVFLHALHEGNNCVFGSRYLQGGAVLNVPLFRRILSRGGSILANLLLGTGMSDMTSGYQGFHARIAKKLVDRRLLSTAHFYQAEVRYLLRHAKYVQIPIRYQSPSPRVSAAAIGNSLYVLGAYFWRRITLRADGVEL